MPKFVTPPPTATGSIVNLDLVFSISLRGIVIYFFSGTSSAFGNNIEHDCETWTFNSEEDAKEFYDGFCNLQASKIVVKVN